jgi:Ice-binding-like/Bacterial Ig-like domain
MRHVRHRTDKLDLGRQAAPTLNKERTMKKTSTRVRTWGAALLLAVAVAGCGGGRDAILGFDWPAAPPTVAAVAPPNTVTGVAVNTTRITADFSQPIQPLTGTATFVVTCTAPCTNPTGSTSVDGTGRIATFELAPGTSLAPSTLYTTTITGARGLTTGLPMTAPFVSTFTTGLAPDTTRPRVAATVPATSSPGPTTGVAANTALTATFSEDMAPASINGASFTLSCAAPCTAPSGTVSYVVGNRTAVFTPGATLAAGATYTATITTAATDLAGNALAGNQAPLPAASNYAWSFSTVAAAPIANLSLQSSNPAAGATNACLDASVNASLAVPSGQRLDPATVNASTFTLTGPGNTSVAAASVVLDAATGRIATFDPAVALVAGSVYEARLRSGTLGIRDLAVPGNTLPADVTFSFTAASCVTPPPIPLASAASFGVFGGSAGATNQGILTVINGDIGTTGVSTVITGFHDAGPGCTYTETPLNIGAVNGLIYTAPPPPTPACPSEGTAITSAIAAQASADARIAYNQLAAMPGGPDPGPGNLANLTLAPGTYTAAAGAFRIQGGSLTLDAQGNPNAIFVFQMATTLTVGGPGAAFPSSIVLANGAQAKNVFWQVGSAATINAGGGGTMVGTIIAQAGVTFSTAGALAVTTLNGRALSLGPVITLVNTVINVPAP